MNPLDLVVHLLVSGILEEPSLISQPATFEKSFECESSTDRNHYSRLLLFVVNLFSRDKFSLFGTATKFF